MYLYVPRELYTRYHCHHLITIKVLKKKTIKKKLVRGEETCSETWRKLARRSRYFSVSDCGRCKKISSLFFSPVKGVKLHRQHAARLRLGRSVGGGYGLQVDVFHRSGHQALQDLLDVDAPLGLAHADDAGRGGGFQRLHAGRLGQQTLLWPLHLGGERGYESAQAVVGIWAVEEGGGLLISDARVCAGDGGLGVETLRGSSLVFTAIECLRGLCRGDVKRLKLFSAAHFVRFIRPWYTKSVDKLSTSVTKPLFLNNRVVKQVANFWTKTGH